MGRSGEREGGKRRRIDRWMKRWIDRGGMTQQLRGAVRGVDLWGQKMTLFQGVSQS